LFPADCIRESPEWLTPAAIFAAAIPKKVLNETPLRGPSSTSQKHLHGKRRFNGDTAGFAQLTAH
jgi:hypothetical protein